MGHHPRSADTLPAARKPRTTEDYADIYDVLFDGTERTIGVPEDSLEPEEVGRGSQDRSP